MLLYLVLFPSHSYNFFNQKRFDRHDEGGHQFGEAYHLNIFSKPDPPGYAFCVKNSNPNNLH